MDLELERAKYSFDSDIFAKRLADAILQSDYNKASLAKETDVKEIAGASNCGPSEPKNYYDAVRLASKTSILPGGKIYTNDSKTVTIVIEDDLLWRFINQENKLFELLGDGSLSERAFSIALDDLRDRMKETLLPEDELPDFA